MNPAPPFDEWFIEQQGIPQPLWWRVAAWERSEVLEADRSNWWQTFVREWLARLAAALGPNYAVDESANFHLLSTLRDRRRDDALNLLESTRSKILTIIGDRIAPKHTVGKHLVMRFGHEDDYYRYVSAFGPPGESATSGGMCIYTNYVHVATFEPPISGSIAPTLAHELTHNLTFHLPQPTWLRESLAIFFESTVGNGGRGEHLRDIMQDHRNFWDPTTIQDFWSGNSFHSVEGQRVSYSLAEVLIKLIQTELAPSPDSFQRFILAADWNDAGQCAAGDYLGIGLEDLISTFLGPGDWAPKPETWKFEKADDSTDQETGTPDETGVIWPEGLEPDDDGSQR